MRLYAVTTRADATRLRRGERGRYDTWYNLDEDGICRVPSPSFEAFSWHDVTDFEPGELPDDWEELAFDIPDDVARPYQSVPLDGGNHCWYVPVSIAVRFLIRQ